MKEARLGSQGAPGTGGVGGQPDQDPPGCRAQRMALLGDKVEVQNGQAMLIFRATEAI